MDSPFAKLQSTARRLAASPTSATALMCVDDPKRALESIDHLVGAILRGSKLPWRVRWLFPSSSSEVVALAHEARDHCEPLLLVLDASQATLAHEDRHESWLRELNTQRELLRPKDAHVVVVIVVPTWLSRRFPELAPDTYSVLDPIVEIGWRHRRLEDEHSGFLDHMRTKFEQRLHARDDAPARYAHGTYEFGYRFQAPAPRLDDEQLREHLASIRGHTGWRPWWVPSRAPIRPLARNEGGGLWQLECWMFENHDASPAHSDYWLAFNDGNLYLLRGYDEDSHPTDIEPGTRFSAGLPLWRAGEALLHALDYTAALGVPEAEVRFFARWTGLRDRELTGWPAAWDHAEGHSTTDIVTSHVEFVASELASLATLIGVVSELTAPLFESFGHRPSSDYIRAQLERMMKP